MTMNDILEMLLQGKSLGLDDTRRLFEGLIGDEPPELKAAVLTALRAKGETETEILGLATQMRRHAVGLTPDFQDALDTCGTGGDGLRTLNLSTLAALLLSSMGVPIAKHGNRSVSSSCGSADLLEGLGLPIDLSVDQTIRLFRETRFAFLFAPHFHPAMKSVAPIRRAMGVRTIFNFLGPLSNPARVRYQILGVPSPERLRPFADVLKGLDLQAAAVVHGEPGMDEVSPCGQTRAAYFTGGGPVQETLWTPEDFGFAPVALDRLAVSGPQEAIKRARQIMDGKGSPEEITAVSVNAGAALWLTGRTRAVKDGAQEAARHLAAGGVGTHWDRIVLTARGLKNA